MGGISLKFISKVVIVLCVVSGVAYLSIRYHQESKETISSKGPSISKKIEQATPTPAKGYSKANADLKSAKVEGQEDSSWVDSVLKALDDPNVKTRVQAVRSLRKHASSPEALDLLSQFLKDKDSVVIRNVIDTLGYIGLQGQLEDEVFNILAQKAMDKDFPHRGDTLTMAAVIGKERLLPTVTDFLHEDKKDENAKNFAVRALSLIDSPECVPLLAEVLSLKTKDPKTHQVAFDTLASIGTPEALALLKEHVISSEGVDQWASAQAMARLDREEFNQVLANELASETLEEETIAVLATSPAAPEIVKELLQATKEKEKQISWLRRVAQYASSGPSEVRSEVASAITPYLDSTDTEIQVEAIKAIAQIGGDDTADYLIPELDEDEPIVRKEALLALWPYATPENYKPLLDMVWDEDQEISRTALIVAERFIKESDRPLLEKAKDHPDEEVRRQVGTILKLMDFDKEAEGNDLS